MRADNPTTLSDKVAAFLREHSDRRFTARAIAEALVRRHPDRASKKQQTAKHQLDEKGLVAAIAAEIGSGIALIQKKYPKILTTGSRPRNYYWSESSFEDTCDQSASPARGTAAGTGLSEADLYPLLGRYLHGELKVWPKRIDERSTTRKAAGFNRWLFPDFVAMELVTGADWPPPVRELARAMWASRARLWSFEVKLRLDRSNLREAFFQAVSNSSWADVGYLVAAEIAGDGTLEELRVLAGLHGIGVIRLDRDDPSESEILVPARARSEVDWASLARLAGESTDMKAFVEAVSSSLGAGQPLKHAFDYVGSRVAEAS